MALTDLTNTGWEFNNTIEAISSTTTAFDINFTCNAVEYTQLKEFVTSPTIDYLLYLTDPNSTTLVYNFLSDTWSTLANYKTIYIQGGTDATNTELITWLQTNATQLSYAEQVHRKLNALADSINIRAGTTGQKDFDALKRTVDSISSGTDTSDATMTSGAQMLSGVTAYSQGTKYTGTIATKTSADMTVSGATVTAPSGYYASAQSKTIASGTEGTPTATKGTVSNHSISVTPSVTNSAGYIIGGTKTGAAVTVSASELVSGTYSVTASGTTDITNYASVSISAGSATTPSSNITANPTLTINNTTGVVTATVTTASAYKSITPTVSSGWVTAGTAGTVTASGTSTLALTTLAATTYTPTTSAQTITAGKYLTGAQTIAGDANLVAGNIKKNITIFGVTGTLEGGGVSRTDTTDSTGGTNVAITGINEITLQDKTVTPTFATSTVTADSGYTGLGSVTLNPYVYNWMGPDAELIQTFPTRSITLANTSFSTWTPTKTATSILATSNVGTFTATSMTKYEYFLQWEFEFTAEYVSGATLTNLPSRYVAMYWQSISRRPSNYTNLNSQTYNSQACTTAANYYLLDYYGATAGTHALAYGTTYGIYHSIVNATFSSSTATSPTVTVKYPAVYARCHDTYMTVAQAPSLATTSPIKMRCKVYRVPLHSMWRTVMEDLIGLYNNPLT